MSLISRQFRSLRSWSYAGTGCLLVPGEATGPRLAGTSFFSMRFSSNSSNVETTAAASRDVSVDAALRSAAFDSSTSGSSTAAAAGATTTAASHPVPSAIRLPVFRFNGLDGSSPSPTSTIDLPADIFGQPLRHDILHRVVRWQLARRQQGTHKTKTRSEVRGGGRKPWQQKGSGRARQGTIRAVQWRGGGVVHGPVVRSHAHDLPKKVRRMGLAVAVSAKVEEGRLVVVDALRDTEENTGDSKDAGDMYKTQGMLRRLDGLLERAEVPVTRRSVLLVDGASVPEAVGKATGNIPWVDVIPVIGLNVYSILQRDVLVMTREAVEGLVTRLHTPIKR